MKKILSLLLAMLMVVSVFAGCNNTAEPTTEPTTEPSTEPSVPAVEIADVTYFSLGYGETFENASNLMLSPSETEGKASVFFVYGEEKRGDIDAAAFADVKAALATSGLVALNGASEYADGAAYASMYIELADGSVLTADYSGNVPQEFIDGFNKMATCFQTLTADLPVYVPQATVAEDVDATAAEAALAILNSGVPGVDAIMVQNAALDLDAETFTWMTGLTSAEGLTNATTAASMMMTTPYAFNMVTVADAATIDAVVADFEANIDWQKWVCVVPTNALIATKDNMVLCVIGEGAMFSATVAGAEAAGWTTVKDIANPAL